MEDLLEKAKAELIRSNADRRHPFRYFYLSTFGAYPEIRTVVKRDFASDWSTVFYTDSRSPKVQQIEADQRVSALFYHPKKQLQLRMKGTALLIDPAHPAYDQHLETVRQSASLKDYLTLEAPGTEIPDDTPVPTGEVVHFLAIRIEPVYLDILQLGKEQHVRCAYRLHNDRWVPNRLIP